MVKVKAQELNPDRSSRLLGGKPVIQEFTEGQWFSLQQRWGSRLRWKRIEPVSLKKEVSKPKLKNSGKK